MGLPWSVGFNRRWGHGMGWKGGALLRAARNGKPWAFSQLRPCGPGLAQAPGFARAAHAQGSEGIGHTHSLLMRGAGSRAYSQIMIASAPEPSLVYRWRDQYQERAPSKGPAGTAITRWHVSTLPRSDQLIFTSYSDLGERGDRPRQARSRETELWERKNPPPARARHITRG